MSSNLASVVGTVLTIQYSSTLLEYHGRNRVRVLSCTAKKLKLKYVFELQYRLNMVSL